MDAQEANREIEQLRAANKQLNDELKSEREKLVALAREKSNRIREFWTRLVLAALFAVAGLVFLWTLACRLLRASGTADEVLATLFGISVLLTALIVVVLRSLVSKR